MIKKIYKVSGMHCTSCALNIEWELEDKGVAAKCDYALEVLEIEKSDENISEEEIKSTVAKLGYTLLEP